MSAFYQNQRGEQRIASILSSTVSESVKRSEPDRKLQVPAASEIPFRGDLRSNYFRSSLDTVATKQCQSIIEGDVAPGLSYLCVVWTFFTHPVTASHMCVSVRNHVL